MKKEYTAVIKKESDRRIGWIEEVPGGNCQECTRDELVETLRLTLPEALAAGSDCQEEKIAVSTAKNFSSVSLAPMAASC